MNLPLKTWLAAAEMPLPCSTLAQVHLLRAAWTFSLAGRSRDQSAGYDRFKSGRSKPIETTLGV